MKFYDQEKLYRLVKDFYNLVGLKVCVYDSAGEELSFYPEKLSSFCALLRQDKNMNKRCEECDRKAFAECRRTYKQCFYICHAGLMECVSPIVFDKKIIGYMVLGQIKEKDHADFDAISNRLPPEKIEELRSCYENLPIIDGEKLESAMRILDACTGYEVLKGLDYSSENKIDVLIEKHINDNLAGDLSVPNLCSEFRLSHSEIYLIFKRYFNASPAEYIKARRLGKACELLEATALQINEIGQKCGFPDYNYFSKIFKRAHGISPREYRKNHGNDK